MRSESVIPLRPAVLPTVPDAPRSAVAAPVAATRSVALCPDDPERDPGWPGPESGRVAPGSGKPDWALLRGDALHEAYAAAPAHAPAAAGFALLVARRKWAGDPRAIVWVREGRAAGCTGLPYGPGLHALGIDPAALTLLPLADGKAVLRAGLDAARDGGAAAVIVELHGRQPLLDLTATRRLALAAEANGTMVLLVRGGAEPAPSAARTRWRVASAPSHALEADAPGHPAFALELLRHRGGREGLQFILEWNRDTGSFRRRPEIGPEQEYPERESEPGGADAAPLSRPFPALAFLGAGARRRAG